MRNAMWVGGGITGMGGIPMLGTGVRGLTTLIKGIFRNNEQGFAYDPNDLTTLYQDAAGTIPVTVAGQPVGLMLDKSKGLTVGAELNATALPKITGNAPVATYNSTTKVGTVNRVDVSNQSFIILSSAVGGKWYYVSVKNTGLSQIALRNSNNFGVDTTIANISPNGTFTGYVYVATNYVLGIASALGEGTFIVNTVKEIAGNHTYQNVSASRPILRQTPILGNELVTNGNFVKDVSGWAGGNGGVISKSLNGMKITSSTSANTQANQRALTLANKVVVVSAKFMNKVSTGTAMVALWSSPTGTIGSSVAPASDVAGVLSFTVQVPNGFSGDLILQVNNSVAGNSVEFSDVTIKEITGYRTDQNYLQFDGVDDFLTVAKGNLKFLHDGTGSSVFIGYTPLSSTYHTLMTSGFLASTGNIGYTLSQDDRSGSGAVLNIITNGNGTSHVAQNVGATGITTKPRVVTTKNKVGTHIIRHNALQILNNPTETGIASTAPSSYDVRIGNSAAGFPLRGRIYSLIGIGRLTSASETIALEKAIAKQTGVTLNV